MEVMLAYDHSRNSRIALEAVKQLFAKELHTVTLISVIEEPGSNTSAGDEMFEAQYQEQKLGAEKAAWFQDTEGNFLCIHEDLPGP